MMEPSQACIDLVKEENKKQRAGNVVGIIK